jgi:hypothetical protein
MNWPSFEMIEMYIYFVHKIDIMNHIYVFNHFNCKVMPILRMNCIKILN